MAEIIGVIALSIFGIVLFVAVGELRKEASEKQPWIKDRFYDNNPKNDYSKKLNK